MLPVGWLGVWGDTKTIEARGGQKSIREATPSPAFWLAYSQGEEGKRRARAAGREGRSGGADRHGPEVTDEDAQQGAEAREGCASRP